MENYVISTNTKISIITFFDIFVFSVFFGITFYVLNSENYEIIE